MFGMINHLDLKICGSPEEAEAKGHVYTDGYTIVNVEKVVVVKNGTVEGNAMVDFAMVDEKGNKYVFMVTANLLKAVTSVV